MCVECPKRRRGQDLNVTLMLAFAIHMEVFASRYVSDCFGVRFPWIQDASRTARVTAR